MNKIRVVLADDNLGLRTVVSSLLNSIGDISVIGEAEDGQEALQLVEQLKPDVLILDIVMPKLNGLSVAEYLHQRKSDVAILVFSLHEDDVFVKEFLKRGVSGYLSKRDDPDDILEAIRRVAKGEKNIFSPRISCKRTY